MATQEQLEAFIIRTVSDLMDDNTVMPSTDTILLGKGSIMDSLLLVGLLVAIEDYCCEIGIPFEWTSDAAMSEKRSHYRTIGTLAAYLHALPSSSGEKE